MTDPITSILQAATSVDPGIQIIGPRTAIVTTYVGKYVVSLSIHDAQPHVPYLDGD